MSDANVALAKAAAAEQESSGPSTSKALRICMILLIMAPTIALVVAHYWYFVLPTAVEDDSAVDPNLLRDWFKVLAMMALTVILPLLAYSYYFYRRERRITEVKRIIEALKISNDEYVEMFRNVHSGPYFIISVGITCTITLGGLWILFFSDSFWGAVADRSSGRPPALSPEQAVDLTAAGGRDAFDSSAFPREGSLLVFGMAFLGAYMWGLQYIFRRYVLNDLIPGAFFKLSIRMLMASILALLVFNAFDVLTGGDGGGNPGHAWPAIAFLLGAFPQRGLNWLVGRIPMLSDQPDPSVRPLPLEMIEGLSDYDRMRLEEIGIDNCYGLANYDFIPLTLKTSYGARKVVDWILQAKLCVRCGDAVASLREQGIRGIHELADLKETEISALAQTTGATEPCLRRAWHVSGTDPDIQRLRDVADRLSRYTNFPFPKAPAQGKGRTPADAGIGGAKVPARSGQETAGNRAAGGATEPPH